MGKLTYQTLRENMVDVVRAKIFNHELAPGMKIIGQDISNEPRVGRGSIREVLRQLGQEGLVEYVGNVGCSVKNITLEDIYEIYLLRTAYETLVIKLYRGVFLETVFAEMDIALESMGDLKETDYNRSVACDNMLRKAIIRSTDLPRLIEGWTDLSCGSVINYYASNPDSQAMVERQYPIYKELVGVCRTENTKEICGVISNHYMETIRRWLKEQGIPENHLKFSIDVIDGWVRGWEKGLDSHRKQKRRRILMAV